MGEEGGFQVGLLFICLHDLVEGVGGGGGGVGEDGDGAALAGGGDSGAVEAEVFVGADELDEDVAIRVAEEGVVGVGVVGGVHQMTRFVQKGSDLRFAICDLRLIGRHGQLSTVAHATPCFVIKL